MAVPEAPMNEYHGFPTRQNNVWSARKVCTMKTEAKTQAPKLPANGKLGLCILGPNKGHEGRALVSAHYISHGMDS
jgi:hypothetical protein